MADPLDSSIPRRHGRPKDGDNLWRDLVTLLESLFVFHDDEYSAVPNGQSIRDTIDEARAKALSYVRSIQIYSEDDVRLATSGQGQRWLA